MANDVSSSSFRRKRVRGTVVGARNSNISKDHGRSHETKENREYSHESEWSRLIFRTRVIRRRPREPHQRLSFLRDLANEPTITMQPLSNNYSFVLLHERSNFEASTNRSPSRIYEKFEFTPSGRR